MAVVLYSPIIISNHNCKGNSMKESQRLYQIEEKCCDVMSISMWYELPDFLFWSITDVMDLNDEVFVVNVYKNIGEKYLEVLLHPPILISIVESLQSDLIVEYIRTLYENKQDVDAVLLSDVESCLFINYEDNGGTNAELFHRIYNGLKEMVSLARKYIQDEQVIFDNLNKIMKFAEENKHEYFSYIKAYWLSLYFYELSQYVTDKTKLSFYRNDLSCIFPNVSL